MHYTIVWSFKALRGGMLLVSVPINDYGVNYFKVKISVLLLLFIIIIVSSLS